MECGLGRPTTVTGSSLCQLIFEGNRRNHSHEKSRPLVWPRAYGDGCARFSCFQQQSTGLPFVCLPMVVTSNYPSSLKTEAGNWKSVRAFVIFESSSRELVQV
jgi:hypothetical protein